jgi:16S rRNA processing protein RimM
MTDFLERLEPGEVLHLDGREVTVAEASFHQGKLLVKLKNVDDVDTARALQFHYLEAPTDFVPELDEDEYVSADLVGLHVFTASGESLGVVNNVLPNPAHDIIVVGEILIPAVKQFVKEVDLEAGRMVVELIEGMRPGE